MRPTPNGARLATIQSRSNLEVSVGSSAAGRSIAFLRINGYRILRINGWVQKAPIDTNLILDLYEGLFRPAVNAGVTEVSALRGWRNTSVGLRGWRYVPPNPKKIPDLIGGFERFIARGNLNPIARAMLTQLEFVTIHPFLDGNGRLGRLLMNHSLLSAGYPWVTVRTDERMPFFQSIERAQVDGDAVPFAQFLWHLIRQSVKEIGGKRAPARRRPQ